MRRNLLANRRRRQQQSLSRQEPRALGQVSERSSRLSDKGHRRRPANLICTRDASVPRWPPLARRKCGSRRTYGTPSAFTWASRRSRLWSTQAGLTFRAKMCLNDGHEGSLVLYETDKYPFTCIGPVRFLWRTTMRRTKKKKKATRTLWIMVSSGHRAASSVVSDRRVSTLAFPLLIGMLTHFAWWFNTCSIKRSISHNNIQRTSL